MENITISCFLGRKNAFPSVFEAEREENMLQVRLELTTSASPAHILLYKYRALTDCATGAPRAEYIKQKFQQFLEVC